MVQVQSLEGPALSWAVAQFVPDVVWTDKDGRMFLATKEPVDPPFEPANCSEQAEKLAEAECISVVFLEYQKQPDGKDLPLWAAYGPQPSDKRVMMFGYTRAEAAMRALVFMYAGHSIAVPDNL